MVKMLIAELIAPPKCGWWNKRFRIPARVKWQVRVKAVAFAAPTCTRIWKAGSATMGTSTHGAGMNPRHAGQDGRRRHRLVARRPRRAGAGLYCYHCEFCRTGHHNVCANIRFLSNSDIPVFRES